MDIPSRHIMGIAQRSCSQLSKQEGQLLVQERTLPSAILGITSNGLELLHKTLLTPSVDLTPVLNAVHRFQYLQELLRPKNA